MDIVHIKQEEVMDKIPAMREMFQKKFADNIAKDVYDKRDVDRFMTDDAHACTYMRMSYVKGDPAKVMDQIDSSFRFRNEMGIWDMKDDDFPQELWDAKGIYYRGNDRASNPILYFDIKAYTPKGEAQTLNAKKFIAHHFEKHHRANPNQLVLVIMDMTGAKVTHLSIDMSKYIINCFSYYFPCYLAYLINYDMPLILTATWKIISAFLAKEQKERVLIVKKKDISTYLDEENKWDHMK